MNKSYLLLLLPFVMGLIACSSDDSEESSGMIDTGSLVQTNLSLDMRGCLNCSFSGSCTLSDVAEVGIEVTVKQQETSGSTEKVYMIPSSGMDANHQFTVNSNHSYQGVVPIYGSQIPHFTYYFRAYAKTGDAYQYGVSRQISVPNSYNLFDHLKVETGKISYRSDTHRYCYVSPYKSLRLALSTDEKLLSPEKILEAETNGVTPALPDLDGDVKVLGNLHLYAVDMPNGDSAASISLNDLSTATITTYYYCEYYLLPPFVAETYLPAQVKMGDMKTYR